MSKLNETRSFKRTSVNRRAGNVVAFGLMVRGRSHNLILIYPQFFAGVQLGQSRQQSLCKIKMKKSVKSPRRRDVRERQGMMVKNRYKRRAVIRILL